MAILNVPLEQMQHVTVFGEEVEEFIFEDNFAWLSRPLSPISYSMSVYYVLYENGDEAVIFKDIYDMMASKTGRDEATMTVCNGNQMHFDSEICLDTSMVDTGGGVYTADNTYGFDYTISASITPSFTVTKDVACGTASQSSATFYEATATVSGTTDRIAMPMISVATYSGSSWLYYTTYVQLPIASSIGMNGGLRQFYDYAGQVESKIDEIFSTSTVDFDMYFAENYEDFYKPTSNNLDYPNADYITRWRYAGFTNKLINVTLSNYRCIVNSFAVNLQDWGFKEL